MLRLSKLFVVPALLVLAACGAPLELEVQDDLSESSDSLALTTGRFETFVGADGRHYFHLLAGNGEKVLASQGYTTGTSASRGVDTVKANGVENAQYRLKEASDGEWYFTLVAGNGAVIGVSETYASQSNAERAASKLVDIVRSTVKVDPALVNAARFQVFKGLDGKYYFHLRANNGQIVLQSQGYATRSGARSGTEAVQRAGGDSARYQLRTAVDGRTYFVLKATNGQVIGRGELYASKSNAQRGVDGCLELLSGFAAQ